MERLIALLGLVISLHVLRVSLSFVFRPKAFDDAPGCLLHVVTITTLVVAASAVALFTIRYFNS